MASTIRIRKRGPLGLALGTLFAVLTMAMASGGLANDGSPSIASDKGDYAPGELVTLTGAGWGADEQVHINVNDDQGQTWSRNADVTADSAGSVEYQFNLPDWFVATYSVTATGSSGAVATTTFTDADIAYSPTRYPSSGWQSVAAGSSFPFTLNATKSGGGADPIVSGYTLETEGGGSPTCGAVAGSIPSSWVSTTTSLPKTITSTATPFAFTVAPPAGTAAGFYKRVIKFTVQASTGGRGLGMALCVEVTAAPSDTTPPTGASISIDDAAAWTNSAGGNVSLDLAATDSVGVTSYRLAETQAALAAASPVAVSPAEASFSRLNVPFTLTGSEGLSKSIWLRVCDAASLCSDASDTIGWDHTAPTITDDGPTPALPNGDNGWYVTAVSNAFSASDGTSGLDAACDLAFPKNVSTGASEGSAVSVSSGPCSDVAGNTNAGINSAAFKIDLTGPSASLAVTAGTLGSNGWYTSDVTVDTSGTDTVSSPVTCTADQFQTVETAGQVFNGSCTNDAGLTTNAAPLTVKLDKTGPTAALFVTAGTLGSNGWYTSDVMVDTSGTDTISSPVMCTADQSQTTETAGQVFNGSCTNDAGLTTNAAPLTVKVDKTAPSLTWNGGPADGGAYYFGSVPAAPTCTADDTLSGPDGCTVTGYSTAVGLHILYATAKDNAGNTTVETRSYNVLAWTLNGFYQPVDMSGTTTVWNTVKNGSTVPLKFNVFAGTTELTTTSVVKSLTYVGVVCSSDPVDEVELTATGGTSLRYDTTGGQFVYNWQTPKTAVKCYRVTMETQDGSKLQAYFRLK